MAAGRAPARPGAGRSIHAGRRSSRPLPDMVGFTKFNEGGRGHGHCIIEQTFWKVIGKRDGGACALCGAPLQISSPLRARTACATS